MRLEDFTKQERGPYRFDWFQHSIKIPSALGRFSLELFVEMGGTPNQGMIDAMQDLVDAFEAKKDEIAIKVFEEYRATMDSDPEWAESCDVPLNLEIEDLASVIERRALTVWDCLEDPDDLHSPRVYMSPQWDEEHGLYFKISNNDIERVEC